MKDVLTEDTNNKIKFWVYGHTHERKMIDINNVTYVNNSRGYPNEVANWSMVQIEI
jgi:UDP-2,3-diacylglucosamine pyrophosphatase LpxH